MVIKFSGERQKCLQENDTNLCVDSWIVIKYSLYDFLYWRLNVCKLLGKRGVTTARDKKNEYLNTKEKRESFWPKNLSHWWNWNSTRYSEQLENIESISLQLHGIPGRIPIPSGTQVFRSKWLHFFFLWSIFQLNKGPFHWLLQIELLCKRK